MKKRKPSLLEKKSDFYSSKNTAIRNLSKALEDFKVIDKIEKKESFTEIRRAYWRFFKKNKKKFEKLSNALRNLNERGKHEEFYGIMNEYDYDYREDQKIALKISLIRLGLKMCKLPENEAGKLIGNILINSFAFMSR